MVERADNSNESTTSPTRPETCSSDESLDRISGLPDFLLLQILSLLEMKDAVKTGVLSKRWEYLWSTVPDLFFRDEYNDSIDYPVDEFINFVNRTLLLYDGSKIRKFRVLLAEYIPLFASSVDSWIRSVVRKKVEELDLELCSPNNGHLYELPGHLYSNASLTKLSLKFCDFKPHVLFSWKLLTSLSLANIYLSDNLIQDILSGSPSLQVLKLQECKGLEHLDITSSSLKELVVFEEFDFTNLDSVLEISAPNLKSLTILGYWYKRCRLRNLQCLVHAILNFEVVTDDEYIHSANDSDSEVCDNVLRELLEKLHHVKDLTIGTWCLEILSTCELEILPSTPSKRKCLILDTYLNEWDLPGIASLLNSSHDLETLVVNMKLPSSTQDFDGQNYWKSTKPRFQCLLHNLKTVKIVGFVAGHCEMDLIEFLLEHAMVLEKMVIYSKRLAHLKWRKRFMPEELLEFSQKILSFPRASPEAGYMKLAFLSNSNFHQDYWESQGQPFDCILYRLNSGYKWIYGMGG